jgi:heptose-I-phosphate ethanolaminephosphotransferase
MLNELRAILGDAATGANLFIVLHTKGSHFDFSRRYPPAFSHFGTPGGSHRSELVDAYDNSILYTDWFLTEVINALLRRRGISALVYASDHGENLLDDEQALFGHALGTPYDLATAAFFWISEAARIDRQAQVQTAHTNSSAKLSLSNIPHSLLDLAAVRAKGFDPTMSIFSRALEIKTRSYMVRGDLRQEAQASGQGR